MRTSAILKLFPIGIRKFLRNHYRESLSRDRELAERQLPHLKLSHQHICHCELLLNRVSLLSHLKKKGKVAEIGVDRGEFSEMILKITEPAILHLIDMWGTERYNEDIFNAVCRRFEKPIAGKKISIHRMLSTDAAGEFPDGYFDWIYLDTDHSYQVTHDELLKYAPKIVNDGILAGHDYSMGNWVKGFRYGVIESVHEFCIEQKWELVYLTVDPVEKQSFAIRRIV